MPSDTLKSLAKKAGKSLQQAEELWKEAKEAADEKGLDPESDSYWAYVTGTIKNMLGLESLDMLRLGYNTKFLSEEIISKSSASFMKARTRKISDEIGKIGSDSEPNWKSLALNLRLFMNEYLSALSSRTGLKALLLGESQGYSMPSILRRIQEAKSEDDLISIYTNALSGVDRNIVKETL